MPGLDTLERFVNNLEGELTQAVSDTLRAGHGLAIQHSSGSLSSAELARRDHPFAVRHGSPQEDPSVINAQRGTFRAAWQAQGPTSGAGGVQGALVNQSREAGFLKPGTRFMFARPVDERIARELAPIFEANVMRAIVRAAR
jgi:hypothetical protein